MKKLVVSFLFLLIVVFGGLIGVKASHLLPHPVPSKNSLSGRTILTLPSSSVPVSQVLGSSKEPGVPDTLSIPTIGVTAKVESVGLDSQKLMDVPKNADDVGWYDLGYKIGQNGNAVIDGHLDKVSGKPAVFWNLSELKSGDKILVTDRAGTTFTYFVIGKKDYPDNNFPLQEVFGSDSKPMLNLITCQGTWNKNTKNYSDRTVVYSQLNN